MSGADKFREASIVQLEEAIKLLEETRKKFEAALRNLDEVKKNEGKY